MNWDTQLSSMLSAADGSVAKMRERLSSKDVYSPREGSRVPGLEAPSHSLHPPSPTVQWGEIAGIQAQLQSQSQAIESLTQALRSMERERDTQHCRLRTLEEELHRLRERGVEREREMAAEKIRTSPVLERRMDQWKREVGRELNSLRDHIDRATSSGNQEESFSSKLRREEIEQLRREVDQLKQQIRRQEEDLFHQQSDSRDTRRQYERNCKTLESLTDSYRTHSLDLAKTVSQYQNTQQDVRQLKLSVTELKEEVRGLILRGRRSTPVLTTGKVAVVGASGHHGDVSASDSEGDFSPTPSLGEVSSDDLSWLPEGEPGPRLGKARAGLSFQLTDSENGESGHGLAEEDEDSVDLDGDLGALSDSLPELSVNDL